MSGRRLIARSGTAEPWPPLPRPAPSCACPSASEVQRGSPACATTAKQFIDAVNGSRGGQHLHYHAARRQFLLKPGGGPHPAVRAGPNDKPLRVALQQNGKILQMQYVTLTPPPVLLHFALGEEDIGMDLVPIGHEHPELVPVNTHASIIVPRRGT